MIELYDLTRLPYDTNGNSRHVVHFPTFLTKEENNSMFLLWAGLQYPLALMRAAPMGGSKYKGKSFGGGIKFQAQESQMQKLAEQAFASFENSKQMMESSLIKQTVKDCTESHDHVKKVMLSVWDHKFLPKHAFAEIHSECITAAGKLKRRYRAEAVWLAAVHLSMELYKEVRPK